MGTGGDAGGPAGEPMAYRPPHMFGGDYLTGWTRAAERIGYLALVVMVAGVVAIDSFFRDLASAGVASIDDGWAWVVLSPLVLIVPGTILGVLVGRFAVHVLAIIAWGAAMAIVPAAWLTGLTGDDRSVWPGDGASSIWFMLVAFVVTSAAGLGLRFGDYRVRESSDPGHVPRAFWRWAWLVSAAGTPVEGVIPPQPGGPTMGQISRWVRIARRTGMVVIGLIVFTASGSAGALIVGTDEGRSILTWILVRVGVLLAGSAFGIVLGVAFGRRAENAMAAVAWFGLLMIPVALAVPLADVRFGGQWADDTEDPVVFVLVRTVALLFLLSTMTSVGIWARVRRRRHVRDIRRA